MLFLLSIIQPHMDQQIQPIQPTQQKQPEFVQPSEPSQKEVAELTIELFNPFKAQFEKTRNKYTDQLADKIQGLVKYRENRTYNLIISGKNDYFGSMWSHMQKQLNKISPHFQNGLLDVIFERQTNIISDIIQNKLFLQQKVRPDEQQLKQKKLHLLREKSSEIQKKLNDINDGINEFKQTKNINSQSRFKPFEIKEQKIKEYQEFLKLQKKQREERNKISEDQKKKQEEVKIKKQKVEKETRQRLIKQKKEELLKKIKEGEQKRQKQRQQREQRDKDYKYISKSLAQQPPLFKKLQQGYYSRYEKEETEKRKKIISQRKSVFQAIDVQSLEQHQRKYEQLKQERERQRKQRMEEYEKINEMQKQQIVEKYKSNYDLKTHYVDKKQQERKLGLEKKEKMKKFIQQTVKERYLPRIDEEKRKEFLKLIEDMNKKKLRKVKLEDGSVQYEEVRQSDPRMIGLEYLEKTKEMAVKMRGRRKNSDNIPNTTQNQKPRIFDYLAEQRKKSSKSHRDKLNFVDRKGLTFDQKLKKVEFQSQKLEEMAKQKEMKLKFGKFSTSDQILQHKQDIDQHYIDIINMKLKLINFKDE